MHEAGAVDDGWQQWRQPCSVVVVVVPVAWHERQLRELRACGQAWHELMLHTQPDARAQALSSSIPRCLHEAHDRQHAQQHLQQQQQK
jgi:hypothetical protein